MVERGAIVIKGGDRLDERRWRKWERFENGLRTAFGQEPRIPSWKNVVSRRQFSRQRGRPRTYVPVSCGQKPPSLPPSPSLLLRLFKKSTKFDSGVLLAQWTLGSRRFLVLLDEDIPPTLPPLSSSRLQNPPFTRGPFMPIALDKVFKAR